MSKVVILMGSPRKNGNTALLCKAFADGAREHNEVEIINVTDFEVSPCKGCNACAKLDGLTCVQRDGMQRLYPILASADVIAVASPVYFYGISSQLKALIDRLHTPFRNGFRVKKLALLLAAASSRPTVFDAIVVQYELIASYFQLADLGRVTVQGVKDEGDVEKTDALQKAYDLGRSIT